MRTAAAGGKRKASAPASIAAGLASSRSSSSYSKLVASVSATKVIIFDFEAEQAVFVWHAHTRSEHNIIFDAELYHDTLVVSLQAQAKLMIFRVLNQDEV